MKTETGMKENYQHWHVDTLSLVAKLKRLNSLLSWLRLLSFLLLAISFVMALVYNINLMMIAGLFLIIFIGLIIYNVKVTEKLQYNETFSKVIDDELAAYDHNYTFDPGEKYIDSAHPYSYDLDIFGQGSLFQSLNRTSTLHGSDRLAAMLIRSLKDADTIKEHQQAIDELSQKPLWLAHFRTYGNMGNTSDTAESELLEWVNSKPLFLSRIYGILIPIIPLISLTVTALLIFNLISITAFTLYLLLPLGIAGFFGGKISKKHMQLSRKASLLNNYSRRLKLLEDEKYTGSLLQKIQLNTKNNSKSAGSAIRQLSKIISSMDARLNWIMWIILNFLLLWDVRQMRRLELWQYRHRDDIDHWFNALAEIEALGSLAGFTIINRSFVFPEISKERLMVKAKEAGHPLIPEARRVTNDILINGMGSFNIVTGANMAGKSTYLRTAGINLVLAGAGAPVCAGEFTFYPASMITSLHTVDSLNSNKSYFFAELERLKQIIDELNSGEELYVFLDEILKGTNSYDKQQGSKALLKQLISLKAAGMIATHDLDLGQLEQSFPANLSNFCFEAQIMDDKLHFDYKIRKGIAQNMNATFLMKHMGITL